MREEKLTAWARQAALDMARIRTLVAGSSLVGRLLSAAFTAMAATRLSSSPAASMQHAESITDEDRERLSGMPMTSTGAERLFALGRAQDVRAGASRDDT
eukprot:2642170-Pleurochrysis_carterae.AAC.1